MTATPLQFETRPFADTPPHVRAEWIALGAQLGANPSGLPPWLEVIDATLGSPSEPLQALTARDRDGNLRGALAFFVRRIKVAGVPLRSLELASNRMAYHPRLVSMDLEQLLDALLEQAPRWDIFYAGGMGEDSADALAMRNWAAAHRAPLVETAGENSPYLAIEGSWQDCIAKQDKKFRYKIKRRREDHDAAQGWSLRWFDGDAQLESVLGDILSIEKRSWKAAEGRDIASRDFEARYHERLLPFLASQRMLLVAVLHRQELPVAYSLCCYANGWFGHLKTSFDASLGATSPGGFVIDASIQKAFELGAKEFDFLGDAAPHKLAWTKTTRRHVNLWLYAPRWLPRMVGRLRLRRSARG